MNFNLKFSYEKFDFIIIGSGQENSWHLVYLKGTVALIEKVCWVELALIMVALLQSLCTSARRIWDIFHEKKWESKIQLAQKQILKSKKRYFSKWFP
jgi:hypothetical protein